MFLWYIDFKVIYMGILKNRRFLFLLVLNNIVLLILLLWLIKTTQISCNNFKFIPLILIGALALFVDIICYDIFKKATRPLEIAEFNKINWKQVGNKFLLAISLSILIFLSFKLFNPIESSVRINSNQVASNIIGGIISGLIGFFSALMMYYYQQNKRIIEEAKNYTEQLWFEMIHNLAAVKNDIRNETHFFTRLENNCWDAVVSSKIFLSGKVKGEIINLYGEISFYNDVCQLNRNLILQREGQNINSINIINDLNKFPQGLLKELEELVAIIFGEMVRLGYRKEKQWGYPEINWKDIFNRFKN